MFNSLSFKIAFADFLFPDGTPQERMLVKGDHDVKLFCKDYVEKAEIMFIIAAAACVLVILSLVNSEEKSCFFI